jgi:MFS family permease
MNDVAARQNYLGPIALAPGITARHAATFVCVALVSIGLLVFLNFMQPYLLLDQIPVPAGALGRLTSRLSIMHEIVVLIGVGPCGALADRLGRPVMFAIGLIGVGLALALCSIVTSISGLTGARLLYACAAAATTATLATVAADYPDNSARGKFLGLLLVTQQLTILFLVANAAALLPRFLVAHGLSHIQAGQFTFRAAALLASLGAVLAFAGLYRGPAPGARIIPAWHLSESLRDIAGYARRQPRFALILLIAFVARGDTAIMSSFLSLWAVKTATAAGASQQSAIATAGGLLSVVSVCGMASAGLVGWLADRLDRLAPLTAGLAAAGLGNIAIWFIHGIGHWQAYAVVGLIAAAETAIIICGQTVLGEQAPPTLRGAAVGIFSVCGSIGVLALLSAGGVLFDEISPQAPFVLLGVVNLLASFAAAVIWRRRARIL